MPARAAPARQEPYDDPGAGREVSRQKERSPAFVLRDVNSLVVAAVREGVAVDRADVLERDAGNRLSAITAQVQATKDRAAGRAPAAPAAAASAAGGGVVDVKVPDIGDFSVFGFGNESAASPRTLSSECSLRSKNGSKFRASVMIGASTL